MIHIETDSGIGSGFLKAILPPIQDETHYHMGV